MASGALLSLSQPLNSVPVARATDDMGVVVGSSRWQMGFSSREIGTNLCPSSVARNLAEVTSRGLKLSSKVVMGVQGWDDSAGPASSSCLLKTTRSAHLSKRDLPVFLPYHGFWKELVSLHKLGPHPTIHRLKSQLYRLYRVLAAPRGMAEAQQGLGEG